MRDNRPFCEAVAILLAEAANADEEDFASAFGPVFSGGSDRAWFSKSVSF
jgi:hypothetical protein